MGDEMRRLSRAAPVILLALVVACAANRAAYATLGITVHGVDLAMETWGTYVVQNPCTTQAPPTPAKCATDAARARVSKTFEDYQKARRVARIAVVAATDLTPTPAEIQAAAAAVVGLVTELTGKKVTP